jgi:hypothetical protein
MAHALRATASVAVLLLGLLLFLITFMAPREDGSVPQPGFLVLCYVLPVVGMAAGAALSPGAARRAWIPLSTALASFGGWFLVVLELW